jgi:hypothetical protein
MVVNSSELFGVQEVSKRELHSGTTPLCTRVLTIPGSGRVKRLQEVGNKMTLTQQGN